MDSANTHLIILLVLSKNSHNEKSILNFYFVFSKR